MTQIEIDANVRVRGNQTASGFEDVQGPFPAVGDTVRVWSDWGEVHLSGYGEVTEIDDESECIFLRAPWSSLTLIDLKP